MNNVSINSMPKQAASIRFACLALCILSVAVYNLFVVKAYWAQRFADRFDQASLERAVVLAPRNATYHDLLCRSMIYVSGQSTRAVDECKKSSELNPYRSSVWLDLAQAYTSLGKQQQSTEAVRRAIAVDPTTPDTAWSAANFFLVQGNAHDALRQFAIVLRAQPEMATPVLNICWQSFHDISLIKSIMPPNPDVYLTFIQLLVSNGEFEPARQIWTALFRLNRPFDYHQALFYVDNLLTIKAAEDANRAWSELSSQSKALQEYTQPNNLVTNGSFSQEILNSGFDWRYTARPNIAVALDTVDYYSASRSLSITYSDSGSDVGVFEYIAVEPNTSYRLYVWVKSEDLETANGPHLTLSDASTNTIYATTQDTVGTTNWHRLEMKLQTGPQTTLLVLAILRSPGETRIQGKIWIDDITLQRI